MSIKIYSVVPTLHYKPSLICQLKNITVPNALERLQKAGVLAVPGFDDSSIVIIAYSYEVALYVNDLRRFGHPHHPTSSRVVGKLRALAAC